MNSIKCPINFPAGNLIEEDFLFYSSSSQKILAVSSWQTTNQDSYHRCEYKYTVQFYTE